MHALQVLSTLAMFFLLCCPTSGATCRNISVKLRGICPFYNLTTEDQPQDQRQIDSNKVIFHFLPLFSSRCSPFSRILLCSTLFRFCSANFVLLPCREVCFSVYQACHHVFSAHRQEWPAYLNCSLLPSSQSLCLLSSSFVHHLPPLNTLSNTLQSSTSSTVNTTQSSTSSTVNTTQSSTSSTVNTAQSSTSSTVNPHPDSTLSHYTSNTLQITSTPPSSPSFNTTLIFVILALVLLIVLVFVFVILYRVFCFHRALPVDRTNAITYTLPSSPSSAPPSSPEYMPPLPPRSLPESSPLLPQQFLPECSPRLSIVTRLHAFSRALCQLHVIRELKHGRF